MTITFSGTGESSADTFAVRLSGIEMLPELGCANHEEADTRLFVHMVYNCRMFHRSRIVIHVNDRYNSFMHVPLPANLKHHSVMDPEKQRISGYS